MRHNRTAGFWVPGDTVRFHKTSNWYKQGHKFALINWVGINNIKVISNQTGERLTIPFYSPLITKV